MTAFDALLARLPAASPLPFALDGDGVAAWLDLSAANAALGAFDPGNTPAFCGFIEEELRRRGAQVLVGGYGEDRALYQMSEHFRSADAEPRTVHLGIDLWLAAGTTVHAVLPGLVHSTQDNPAFGDYGPTVILEHAFEGERFHTLYGHLSRSTLQGLVPGQSAAAGERLGWLGEPQENVGWPPHLHFQIIRDLDGRRGDYPGVCRPSEAARWLANCPDPQRLLRIGAAKD